MAFSLLPLRLADSGQDALAVGEGPVHDVEVGDESSHPLDDVRSSVGAAAAAARAASTLSTRARSNR